jgi:hypothetical protein
MCACGRGFKHMVLEEARVTSSAAYSREFGEAVAEILAKLIDFSNGYLFGEILNRYQLIDDMSTFLKK